MTPIYVVQPIDFKGLIKDLRDALVDLVNYKVPGPLIKKLQTLASNDINQYVNPNRKYRFRGND